MPTTSDRYHPIGQVRVLAILRRGLGLYLLYAGYASALYAFKDLTYFRFPSFQPYAAGALWAFSLACLLLLFLEFQRRPQEPRSGRLFVLSFLLLSPLACDYMLFNDELVSVKVAIRILIDPLSINFFNYGVLVQLFSILFSAPVLAVAYVIQNGFAIPAASALSHSAGGASFQSMTYFSLHLSSMLLLSVTPLLAYRVARRLYADPRSSAAVFLLTLLDVAFVHRAALFLPHPFLAPVALLALSVVLGIDEDSRLRSYLCLAAITGVALAVFPASYPLVLLLGAVLFVDRRRLSRGEVLAVAAVFILTTVLANPFVIVNKLRPEYAASRTGLEWIVPTMIKSMLSEPLSAHLRHLSRLALQLSNGMSFPVLSAALGGVFVAAVTGRRSRLQRPLGFILFLLGADFLAKVVLQKGEIRFLFSSLSLLLLLVPMIRQGVTEGPRASRWALLWGGAVLAAVMAPDVLARVWSERRLGFEVPCQGSYLWKCLALWTCVLAIVFGALAWMIRRRRGDAVLITLLFCAVVHFAWFQRESLAGSNQYRMSRHFVMRRDTDYAYVSWFSDFISHWTPKSNVVAGRRRPLGPDVLATEHRLVVSSASFNRFRPVPPEQEVLDADFKEFVPNRAHLDFYGSLFWDGRFDVASCLRPPVTLFDGVGVEHTFPYMLLMVRRESVQDPAR